MLSYQAFNQMMSNAQQMQNLQQQFQAFQQQFAQGPQMVNSQAQVQQMLSNGTMTQQDFEQCRRMANMLTGMNY